MRLIDKNKLLREVSFVSNFLPCGLNSRKDELRKWIDKQPEISLENKTSDWIPCSERLPEKECLCLVTIKKKNGGYKVNTELYSYDNHGIGGFYTFDYIVAWMPLPEPYKE